MVLWLCNPHHMAEHARIRRKEFLKERRVVFPAESALLRLVGEQKKLAHESIVTRIAELLLACVVYWQANTPRAHRRHGKTHQY